MQFRKRRNIALFSKVVFMKRNHFLASLFAISSAPLTALAKVQSRFFRTGKGIRIASGEGRIHGHMKMGGPTPSILDLKVSGSDTDGDLSVFEHNVLKKGASVPLHYHPDQDEMFFILEGKFRFKVGDDMYDLGVGDSIFLPRKIPHNWILLSDRGRTHLLFQPAGKMEKFFATIAAFDHKVKHTAEEVAKLSSECGMVVVGPRLQL